MSWPPAQLSSPRDWGVFERDDSLIAGIRCFVIPRDRARRDAHGVYRGGPGAIVRAHRARRPREWEIWARLREIEGDSSRNAWHFIFCHARGVRAIGVSVSRTAQAAAGPPSSATVRTTRAAHARRDWGEIGGDCEMIHQMLTLNVSSPPAIELAVSHSTSAAAIRAHGTPPPTRAGDWARLREIGGDWARCEHFMARNSPSLSRD